MSDSQEFAPDWVSAPGDTIADILSERGLTSSELAASIGRTTDEANEILKGRAAITIGVARRLEEAIGGSMAFWMSRDFHYQRDILKIRARDKEWVDSLPVGDMLRFGWLTQDGGSFDETAACLRFFDVPSVTAWRERYALLHDMVAFRTSPSPESRPAAVAAWLRQGEKEAGRIACDPWDAERFDRSLTKIRSLTRRKAPAGFVPELQKMCAEAGVAVVVVRAPEGCRASGATRFLSKDKTLIQLSFRYLTDDQFWFTLFHEAGHLLLHGVKGFFLEGPDSEWTAEEEEANEFAGESLIPAAFRRDLLDLRPDWKEVIRFSSRIGVSPGIVVGQLQHAKRIRLNQLNRLKRRYRWGD